MGRVVSELLKNVKIPRMFKVKQLFPEDEIKPEEIPALVHELLSHETYAKQIQPGMNIAITCGSRQIANIIPITKAIVDFVKAKGANPFIAAAMGSHGGATSEGQRAILKAFGITEEAIGCPVKTSMDVVKIGTNEEGMDVYIDKDAAEADGIIVSCRIKPHTCFRGPYESGIMKMMTIGLGKQIGAGVCHEAGFKYMAKYIPMFGTVILEKANILFAVAILENAYDETAKIVAVNHDEIAKKEPGLLEEAKSLLPKIYLPECDLLIVDTIGKNFSGSGMDPNITGTFITPYASGGLISQRVAVLDLSDESHHSGVGVGMSHATTKRLFEKIDFDQTYPNLITSKVIENARIPMVMKNDKEAIQVCLKTLNDVDRTKLKIIRIPNTLKIGKIWLSEAYYEEAQSNPCLIIESEPAELKFDEDGNLTDLGYVQ